MESTSTPPTPALLLVDDEPNIISALKRVLRREGYRILTANSGAQGLEVLERESVAVIVSDQRMPEMNGVEFLQRVKARFPDVVRIILSGYTDLKSVTDAINEGSVYKFLTKPWDDKLLVDNIREAFERYGLRSQNHDLASQLEAANRALADANHVLSHRVEDTTAELQVSQTILDVSRNVLDAIPLPVIGVDNDGTVVLANSCAVSLFNNPGGLVGRSMSDTHIPWPSPADSPTDEQGTLTLNGRRYRVVARPTPTASGYVLTFIEEDARNEH